ncbi:MAG: hypothetical protein IAI50_13090 [Candidatus Eremiobacteraeota bacterium]|nr:hypothetical protein [Candidatus Eremiobacteraeota bacterium]
MGSPAARKAALSDPIEFMLQGSNAQAIASWSQAWRLNHTLPYVSYTISTPAAWWAQPTQSFDSYASLAAVIGTPGAIGPNVTILLYDNEKWPATPLDEQQAPQQYETQFCALAHSYNYACMTAPALDLVVFSAPQTQWQAYLSQNYPQFSAAVSDFYEIQAQGYERNPVYATLVNSAAQQAQNANSNIWVLSGLTTNSPPQEQGTPTLQNLTDDIAATRTSATGGFWLNIPSPGPNCPNCGPPNIPLAESLIQAENFKAP